jgi:hypothetical protein
VQRSGKQAHGGNQNHRAYWNKYCPEKSTRGDLKDSEASANRGSKDADDTMPRRPNPPFTNIPPGQPTISPAKTDQSNSVMKPPYG